ncbi:hypothetical protein [Methylobrevis albus]|uniref:Uncharacterized protein n=1 Tax=Methylobrevis albus TaxID=2793297 RepID=A0A931I491_9HYPH|nr:hypothetical protein [Methylobrevis albus]MBH0238955.1 hypothetical protein [Methylobrevis albus]
MILTLEDMKKKFFNLIDGVESREQIAEFASLAMRAGDADNLFVQPEDFIKVWRCLGYLSGVDLEIERGVYLHSNYDFIEEMKTFGFIEDNHKLVKTRD